VVDERNEDGPPLIVNPTSPTDWRLNRLIRFKWRQLGRREWIQFHEIAEWYAEFKRGSMTEEAARASAYDMLQRDLLYGDFEEDGRSRVRFLHPAAPMAWMTTAFLCRTIEIQPEKTVREQYLSQCWIPRRLFKRWLAKHELPLLPARFEPQEDAVASDEERQSKRLRLTSAKCLTAAVTRLSIGAANEASLSRFAVSNRTSGLEREGLQVYQSERQQDAKESLHRNYRRRDD